MLCQSPVGVSRYCHSQPTQAPTSRAETNARDTDTDLPGRWDAEMSPEQGAVKGGPSFHSWPVPRRGLVSSGRPRTPLSLTGCPLGWRLPELHAPRCGNLGP